MKKVVHFTEGIRNAKFLGEEVIKYHGTLTTYLNSLIKKGFEITGVIEPEPEENMLNIVPGMLKEPRRTIMCNNAKSTIYI